MNTGDVRQCLLAMEQNFGKQYSAEMSGRVQLLFSMCLKDSWTSERFTKATEWILKNKPYPNWTVADFFSAPLQKLYPRSEHLKLLSERGKGVNAEIQWYNVNGVALFAWKHEGELPFNKFTYRLTNEADCPEPETMTTEEANEKLREWGVPKKFMGVTI